MTEFEEHFPHVQLTGNAGRTLAVEQEQDGHLQRVALHAVHVRFMAETLGLLPAPSADAAGLLHRQHQAPALLADLARMERALLRIHTMSSELAQSLGIVAEHCQEDLSHEVARAGELSDFVAFICEDFERAPHAAASPHTAPIPLLEGTAA